jgi:hypothetical protein
MTIPTQLEAERQVAQVRSMYGRFLSIWASQLLELERIGSRRPSLDSIVPASDLDHWSIAA